TIFSRDWSSDVCSSDLDRIHRRAPQCQQRGDRLLRDVEMIARNPVVRMKEPADHALLGRMQAVAGNRLHQLDDVRLGVAKHELTDRKSVVEGGTVESGG